MDCSASLLAVGIRVDEEQLTDVVDVGVKHGEQLMPRLDALCRRMHLRRAVPWDLVVCGRGPGSFSGVRIALATAKGLALACGAPFVLVPTLTAWAATVSVKGTVLPVIDARRDSVYTQAFVNGESVSPVWDLAPSQLSDRIRHCPRPWHAVGPGASLLAEETDHRHMPDGNVFIAQLFRLGQQLWNQRGGDEDLAGPHYLRAAVPQQGNFVSVASEAYAAHFSES